MTKKLNEKFNSSTIKLFEFILMLYEGEVEYKKVISHFSKNPMHITSNTHVTLNKYLNCFRAFGMEVNKIKNKYIMTDPLYELDLASEDLKSLKILNKAKNALPEGKNKKNFNSFMQSILIRLSEEKRNEFLKTVEDSENLKLNIDIDKTEQIKLCEKYCQENYKVEVVYRNLDGDEINIIGSPREVVYLNNQINLKIIGHNGSRIFEIPIDKIKFIKQLPLASSGMSIPTTIVYKITDRLAKNYKLRDWEKLEKVENDGSLVIVNKNEDFELLIKRLMRYGTKCEVISPKFVRIAMAECINKTLSNYQ